MGNLRKPLGTRAARPHLLEKCGHDARAPSKKRGFRSLPMRFLELVFRNYARGYFKTVADFGNAWNGNRHFP